MDKIFDINKILNMFNYVIWMLLGNIFFIILNLPILLFLTLVDYKNIHNYTLLFAICLLPLGPSLTALLYSMGKLVRYKDVSITKDFFRGYKINFKTSLGTTTIQVFLLFILYTNINYFKKLSSGYFITPFFYILAVVLILMSFYAYPLIARFHIKTIDVLKASMTLTFSTPFTTIINVVILLFSILLYELRASLAVLFDISILCYLLMYWQNKLFIKIEKNNSNNQAI